jgi:diguanylate cyclase (GGDEF)-like protein
LLVLLAERLRSIREQYGRRIELSKATERSASIDPLTGLYNRRWLDHALPLAFSDCLSKGEPLSLMMMDLDHFKQYNDTHGHPAGDCVLQQVAESVTMALRDADRAARYGGEEFCVLLPGVDGTGALSIAERVCEAVRKAAISKPTGDALPSVTISVGLAEMAPDDTAHSLIEKADRALYCAKHCGRDRVCRWTEGLG